MAWIWTNVCKHSWVGCAARSGTRHRIIPTWHQLALLMPSTVISRLMGYHHYSLKSWSFIHSLSIQKQKQQCKSNHNEHKNRTLLFSKCSACKMKSNFDYFSKFASLFQRLLLLIHHIYIHEYQKTNNAIRAPAEIRRNGLDMVALVCGMECCWTQLCATVTDNIALHSHAQSQHVPPSLLAVGCTTAKPEPLACSCLASI